MLNVLHASPAYEYIYVDFITFLQNHNPEPPRKKAKIVETKELDADVKDLMVRMDMKLDKIAREQEKLNKRLDSLMKSIEGGQSVTIKDEDNDEGFVVSTFYCHFTHGIYIMLKLIIFFCTF